MPATGKNVARIYRYGSKKLLPHHLLNGCKDLDQAWWIINRAKNALKREAETYLEYLRLGSVNNYLVTT